MKFLIKYWAQITGVVVVLVSLLGWLWNLKTRLDNYVNTQQQLVVWMQSAQSELDEHDSELDDHNDKLLLLNKIEELREKGLLK